MPNHLTYNQHRRHRRAQAMINLGLASTYALVLGVVVGLSLFVAGAI